MKALLGVMVALLAGFVGGIAGTLTVLHHEKAVPPEVGPARQFGLIDLAGLKNQGQ